MAKVASVEISQEDLETAESLGQRVRLRRLQMKISQMEIAKAAKVERQNITVLEADGIKRPRNLNAIAERLHCRVGWLLTGELPVEPQPTAQPVAANNLPDDAQVILKERPDGKIQLIVNKVVSKSEAAEVSAILWRD